MGYVLLNDLHFGVGRSAGTTPASRLALKKYLIDSAKAFISGHCRDDHLIILGDLFDGFTVDESDVLEVFDLLNHYLCVSSGNLFLVAGNHDWNPRGDKVSSFHLLARIMSSQSTRVTVLDYRLSHIEKGLAAIPHCPNQDLFDLELEAAHREMDAGFLLLHANCDSEFATHSDHSLNVNREWIHRFRDKGITLVFAHEHQRREFQGVQVLGNQFPSSIADCLGNTEKFAWRITGSQLEPIQTWHRSGNYLDVNWRELANADLTTPLIRVSGDAASSEAEAVVNALSSARRASSAFVIANAVRVDGMAEMENMAALNADAIRSFDVLAALLEELDEKEREVVKGLLR